MIRARTVHDRLPRQPRAQVTLRAGHDAKTADHVVIDFAAAAIDLRVRRGKVMFHVNPLADHLRSGHDGFEQPPIRVSTVVVRMEEYPSVELYAARERAPADDECGIAGESPLRAYLAPVGAAAADLSFGSRSAASKLGFRNSSATLQTGSSRRFFQAADEFQHILAMGRRKVFEIEQLDIVRGGVVLAGYEVRILWNSDAVVGELFAHRRPIGHNGERARVGFARVAAAGAAIEGCFERIVFRAAAVAAKKHEAGEVTGQAHHSQHGFHGEHLFAQGKAGARDAFHARERSALIDTVVAPEIVDECGFFLDGKRDGARRRRGLACACFIESAAPEKFQPLQ